jgi:hypothetical protein
LASCLGERGKGTTAAVATIVAAAVAAAVCLFVLMQHRYYGKTQPFGPHSWRVDPSFLTAEQAMADYAALLHNLTHTWGAADRYEIQGVTQAGIAQNHGATALNICMLTQQEHQ